MRYPAHIRKEAKLAEKMHWTLVRGRHLKWYDETGRLRVTTAMTPSTRRGVDNAKSRLRKNGIRA